VSGRSERLLEVLLRQNLKPMDAPIRGVNPINLRLKRKSTVKRKQWTLDID
jgi:hypothetical protein